MNLGKLLEGGIQDLSWLSEGKNYDPSGHSKSNDIKPELEFQWGAETNMHGEYKENIETVEDDANLVSDTPREVKDGESDNIEMMARKQIASGKSGAEVLSALNGKFGKESVLANKKVLASAFANDGISGCIAVDCAGFKTAKEAFENAKKSPHKRFLAYVINYNGDIEQKEKLAHGFSGGGIDDLLGDTVRKVASVPYCKELGMPILSTKDELSDEFIDDTLIDLMTLSSITEEEVNEIKSSRMSNLKKVREAFRLANRKAVPEKRKYSNELPFEDFVEKPKYEIEVPEAPMANLEGVDAEIEPVDEIELSDAFMGQEILKQTPVSDDLDFYGDFESQEVEPQTFIEDEFVGCDILDLDETPERDEELEVDGLNEFGI